ncbi:MAG TPA: DUF305 domain-containing protein [Pseudonocardia sp.]|nr:DUF305 domain-containing protein [Pseudonocardia sp.]
MTSPAPTPPASTPAEDEPMAGGEPRWVRPFVVSVAVVGLLLLGAAAGLLIRLPGSAPAVPEPGPVDIGFAQDMTVHHEQAVTMASWARDNTEDPAVRQLAYDIESTQTAQIGRMQGWLALWDAPGLPVGGHMAWMSDAAGHDHGGADDAPGGVSTMPGMASQEELADLRATTGRELDVLFLQLMLRHHQGGVGMLQYASENASVPDVRNLASQMLSSQTSEAEYLNRLLTERGGTPLPL